MWRFTGPGSSLLVLIAGVLATRRAQPAALRHAWRWFVGGAAAQLLAEALPLAAPALATALLTVGRALAGSELPVAATVLRLLSYVCFAIGLRRYPAPAARLAPPHDLRLKQGLDMAFHVVAGWLLVAYAVHPGPNPASWYPFIDALLAAVALARALDGDAYTPRLAAALCAVGFWLRAAGGAMGLGLLGSIDWALSSAVLAWSMLATVRAAPRMAATPADMQRLETRVSNLGVFVQLGFTSTAILLGGLIELAPWLLPPPGPWFSAVFVALFLLLGVRYAALRNVNEHARVALRETRADMVRRAERQAEQFQAAVTPAQLLRNDAERRAAFISALQEPMREILQSAPLAERLRTVAAALAETRVIGNGFWIGVHDPASGGCLHAAESGTLAVSDDDGLALPGQAVAEDERVDAPADGAARPARLLPPGHALAVACRSGQLIHINDPATDRRLPTAWRRQASRYGVRRLMFVPLAADSQVAGTLAVWRHAPLPPAFETWEIKLLEDFSSYLSLAIIQSRQLEEARRRADEEAALLHATGLLSSTLDLDQVLDAVARESTVLLDADLVAVYLYDREEQSLTRRACAAARSRAIAGDQAGPSFVATAASPAAQEVLRSLQPTVLHPARGGIDAQDGLVPNEAWDGRAVRWSLVLPLLSRAQGDGGQPQVQGLLVAHRSRPDAPFAVRDAGRATALAQHVGLAMANARLYGELQARMNQLTYAQAELLRLQRLESVRQMVAGAAHELNNPLAVLQGYAELLLRGDLPNKYRHDVQGILTATERCHKIVSRLMTFGGQGVGEMRPMDVNATIQRVVDLLAPQLEQDGITVQTRLKLGGASLGHVSGDSELLQQVFIDLIGNAGQALRESGRGGTITIVTRDEWREGERVVRVEVHDDGPGIPAELLDKVFDPFFTTHHSNRQDGGNPGLGLSVAFGIVRRHNGRIWAESPALLQGNGARGPGATVIVELSSVAEAPARPAT